MQLSNLTRLLALNIPASNSTVDVKAINSFNAIAANVPLNSSTLLFPVVRDTFPATFLAFVVEHNCDGERRRVMFDIGLRKDPENLAPAAPQIFPTPIPDDVPSQLESHGHKLKTFEAVIWSHSHLDHIGDMSLWPKHTDLVIGEATDTRTYPKFPNATLLDSDFAGRTVRKVSFKNTKLNFGGFAAFDYFKDGSFYLLDAPGHQPGNMIALARVTPTTFILMAGDSLHHVGQIRPSPHLRHAHPIPKDILADSKKHILRKYFFAPDDKTDLSNKITPFFSPATFPYYFDPSESRVTQFKLGLFDSHPDVLILASHDATILHYLDLFPKKLNNWKQKGWKTRGVWEFASSKNIVYVLDK